MTIYFLALALVFDLQTRPPVVASYFTVQEQCHIEAEKRTHGLSQAMRDKGMMFVCLKLEYPGQV